MTTLLLVATLAILAMPPAQIRSSDPPPKRDAALQQRLEAIADSAPGRCLIAVRHLESGRSARVNTEHRAPMASVVKLPVALAVLHEVTAGRLALATPVALLAREMNPNASRIADQHPQGGVEYSVHDLLEAMLVESDNTACDALLRTIGGPAAVRHRLDYLRLEGISVDRTEMQLGNDWFGLVPPEPESAWNRDKIAAWRRAVPEKKRRSAAKEFMKDPRDSAYPTAFEDLLLETWRRRTLSAEMTDTLLAMMERSTTGPARLRAGFPPPSRVAHKTGTGGASRGRTACVNDVGLVRLPGGGGTVAIVVMIHDVRGEPADAERVIARIAAAVFEMWNAPE